jgi:hypothetical protein
MRAETYIFVPLTNTMDEGPGSRAENWREGDCLSDVQAGKNLKLYGRLAGIPEKKLNLRALRNTAIRLHLEAGHSLEEMRAFLGSQVPPALARYRLRHLPQLPEGDVVWGGGR